MESGIPRERVVAVVASLRQGVERIGSGYLVSECTVLTAAHCTRGEAKGDAPERLRVIRASDGGCVEVTETIVSEDLDVAVLRLADTAEWPSPIASVVYARVDRQRSGTLFDCEAVGFPLLQRDATKKTRGTAEIHCAIYQTDEAEAGRLLLHEPRIRPGDVTDELANLRERKDVSPWSGMSGAVVFYRGLAIGIVEEHHPRQGDSALRALSFDTIAKKAGAGTSTQRLSQILGLPAEAALVWARPDSPDDLPDLIVRRLREQLESFATSGVLSDPREKSRRKAEKVVIWAQWPTAEARQQDNLEAQELYWTVHVDSSSKSPATNIVVTCRATRPDASDLIIDWIQPAARGIPGGWYHLRDLAAFDPNGEPPELWIDFTIEGVHWRRSSSGFLTETES